MSLVIVDEEHVSPLLQHDNDELPDSSHVSAVAYAPAPRRRPARELAVLVAIVTVAFVFMVELHEIALGNLVHSQARAHLVSDFAAPSSSATVPGRAHGAIQIPSLGINEIVIEGDSDANLRAGPAHRRSTPALGELGNALVFGHARRYGGPFRSLSRLKPGDVVVVQPRNGKPSRLAVTSVRRVGAHNIGALGPSTDRRLTLVTSADRYSSDRIVVVAVAGDPAGDPGPPRRGFNPPRESPVFNTEMGTSYVVVVGAAAALGWLRRRHRLAMAVIVAVPVLALGLLLALRSLELVLPATL